MSTIQFDEQGTEFTSRKIFGEKVKPKMIAAIEKLGLAKTDAQALRILIAITFIIIATTLYILYDIASLSSNKNRPAPPLGAPIRTAE